MVQVSVIGSGPENEERAEQVGRLLGASGATVFTGGLGEVMAAVSRGAKSAGGTTIGIVPGESRSAAATGRSRRSASRSRSAARS
jgi:uncharacterized protein (TIGR00725 family)